MDVPNLNIGSFIGGSFIAGIVVALVVVGTIWIGFTFENDRKVQKLIRESQKEESGMPSLYDDVKADLSASEGRVDHVYLDTEGFKTAGIGHRLVGDEVRMELGARVYDEQVDEWFQKDIAWVFASLAKHFPEFNSWPRLVQLAVVNWIFQIGAGAPEKFPHATKALQAKDWERAADEWIYANVRTRRHSEWFKETPQRCRQEVGRLRHVARYGDKLNDDSEK